jgi:hypothetical protein
VELLSASTVAHSKTSAYHGVENTRPSIANDSKLRQNRHVGAGHGKNVVTQIDLTITSSSRDKLGVGDVTRMSAGTSHVSETVKSLTETRSLTTMVTFKIFGNERRALEVGGVGIRVVGILKAGNGRSWHVRRNGRGLLCEVEDRRSKLTGVNNASSLHVSRNELDTLLDLLNEMRLGLGK